MSVTNVSKPAISGTKKALAVLAKCLICKLCLVGRGNLKPVGMHLFLLINNHLINLLGIPVGTLRGLDSDGRCCLIHAIVEPVSSQ